MAKKKYTIKTAKAMIERNGGKVGVKSISHRNPGLTTLGAIDFLVNQCGYKWVK